MSVLTLTGCALSRQRADADRPPAAETPEKRDGNPNEPSQTGATVDPNGHKPTETTNGESQLVPPVKPSSPVKPLPPDKSSPWSVFTAVRNGLASNVNFDEDPIGSYGAVLATGVDFTSDAFEVSYEIAGHRYTNTSLWNRVSHAISATFERDLTKKLSLDLEGNIGFKGSSEDRDLVDQDLEISPQFDYRFTPARRLTLFTKHRMKRYDDPSINSVKNYIGVEFLETMRPRHYVQVGGRFETNDARRDRSDSRRWTYWVAHGIPLTERDAIALQVRYRLKRYTRRLIEVEDEDVPRVDHRWTPTVTWIRALGPKTDLTVDYLYETTYSNDPEEAYRAHMVWSSLRFRWR